MVESCKQSKTREPPPLLFDLINMAGGALPNGDLSRVQITRRGGPGGTKPVISGGGSNSV